MTAESNLQRLQAQHLQIAELFLGGQTVSAIAHEIGLLPNSVSRIIQAPMFQDYVARRRREQQVKVDDAIAVAQGEIRRDLVKAGTTAVKTLDTLMVTGSQGIQLKAASEVLKMAFELEGSGKALGPSAVPMSQVNIAILQSALKESVEPLGILDVEVEEGEPDGSGTT